MLNRHAALLKARSPAPGILRNDFLTTCSHPWAMNRQKLTAIFSLLFIATGIIGALYSLGHTRSVFSFICLCAVMLIAVMATAAFYTSVDQQQQ
jgi:hypothetical protein